MFKRIKMRIRDVRTVSKLIAGADEEAHLCGEEKPGAEHFFLSAFKLSDHTAQNVFDRLDLKPDQFREAITKQYHDALKSVGIDTSIADLHSEPIEPDQTIHNSKPSGQAVMKALYSLKKTDKNRPLLGAHVLSVVANMQYGVASRALKTMGIDQKQLTSAIKKELASYPG